MDFFKKAKQYASMTKESEDCIFASAKDVSRLGRNIGELGLQIKEFSAAMLAHQAKVRRMPLGSGDGEGAW